MSGVNRIKDVANLLGVELRKKFNVIDGGEYLAYSPYYFTRYGLIDKDGDDANPILPKLIRGDYIIEKVPLVPKTGDV